MPGTRKGTYDESRNGRPGKEVQDKARFAVRVVGMMGGAAPRGRRVTAREPHTLRDRMCQVFRFQRLGSTGSLW